MDEFSKSVMIALLPTTQDWCAIDLPHLTLVYVGEIPELRDTILPEISKDVYSLSKQFTELTLTVLRVEVFGGADEDKVDAFRLFPSRELTMMREKVERWNGSEFMFNPHVTIGPVGTAERLNNTPDTITFDRICLSWGEENLMYMLRPATQ